MQKCYVSLSAGNTFSKLKCGLTPKPPAVSNKLKLFAVVSVSHSFINADCFTLGIDPRDAFLIFDVHRYVPVVTFGQYFITNTVVLAC